MFSSKRTAGMPALATAAVLALGLSGCGGSADAGDSETGSLRIGLVTKTETNPFYVAMREAAEEKAAELEVELQTFSGRENNDNDSQVMAVENLISQGVDGILITPADSAAIVPTIDQAREAGIVVFALDTPTQPEDAVDATFATDNFRAGQLIGEWAHASADNPDDVRIALLDQDANNTSVDVARNQGFLDGFGIDLGDPSINGDEDDPRIAGNYATESERDEGRNQMENALQANPELDIVYSINEVVAAGAYEAILAAGREDEITMVSVDGGCPGVEAIAGGTLGATAMQFPSEMAIQGMEAMVALIGGEELTETQVDTGSALITDDPIDGIESHDSEWGLENCWG
ncbi:sugar ABC transporter substrate-binding protein [Sediminivirga luteola]|uniref:Sugar ABC transporter n=1 Tax=Sediminivirga luteola TaxID=1774748 RepID=A0A8J2XJ12_9MICO|nr:substrate-binding domain-containing protein [Sediminivirga luteola]GGA18501.1 sugar ABC transporter [Sediminivirga luteola]